MYKTGDINQNLDRLKIELRKIKYSVEIFESENISNGNPVYFLPIIHYVILDYSKHIAKTLVDNNYELFSKSDQEFVSKVFRALIELFNFKPNITIKQFFSFGYSEAKVILCLEIIRIIKGEHNNLIKKSYASSKPPVNKIRKNNANANTNANDSFRSLRKNEVDSFIDYTSNHDKNHTEDFRKKNKLPLNHEFIDEDFPNATSPKFSENPNYEKKNYNFDRKLLKKQDDNENEEKLEKYDEEKDKNKENDYSNEYDIGREYNHFSHEKKNNKIIKGKSHKNQDKYNSDREDYHNCTEKEVKSLNDDNYDPLVEDAGVGVSDSEIDDPKAYNYHIGDPHTKNKTNFSNRYKEYDSNNLEKNKTMGRKCDSIFKEKDVRDDYIINVGQFSKKQLREEKPRVNIENIGTDKTYNKECIQNIHPSKNQNNTKEHCQSYSNSKAQPMQDKNLNDDTNSFSNYKPLNININNHGNPSIESKNRQKNNNNNNNSNLIEFSSFIDIINSLANSVKEMTGKVDNFKTNIENRVEKLEAELTLIKNKLSIIESRNTVSNHPQNYYRAISNSTNANQDLNNEDNEHIFSFADDPNTTQNQLVNKLEIISEDAKKTSYEKNKIMNAKIEGSSKQNNYNNIHNTFSHKTASKDSNASNNYSNKLPNKILNDIEDTDTIIQRISNRFKETQKLLNEFN